MQMRAERAARRDRTGNVTLRLAEAERTVGQGQRSGESLAFRGARTVCSSKDFSTTITRGDKILDWWAPTARARRPWDQRLLLGQLQPTGGLIKHGTNLEVVYFDQHREQIDDDKTVADNIANGNSTVTIDGRSRHVISYLQDFLFSADRARTPARVLSGGERNRLLLARLFTKPANVLVMDEPTNDLDAETLDLLEDLLVEFQGTLLLVSHDREFLDNVVTSTLVLEGDGRIGDYIGGYSDWQRYTAAQKLAAARAEASAAPAAKPSPGKKGRSMNAKETRDLCRIAGSESRRWKRNRRNWPPSSAIPCSTSESRRPFSGTSKRAWTSSKRSTRAPSSDGRSWKKCAPPRRGSCSSRLFGLGGQGVGMPVHQPPFAPLAPEDFRDP